MTDDDTAAEEAARTVVPVSAMTPEAAEEEARTVVPVSAMAPHEASRYAWTQYPEHRSAVAGAIAELAPTFDLQAAGDDRWEVRVAGWPAVRGEVVVRVDGDVTTAVGVQLHSVVMDQSPWTILVVLISSLGAGAAFVTLASMILPLLNYWVAIALALLVVLPLMNLVVVASFMGLAVLGAAWNTRKADRWIARWHRRFAPALAGRLAGGRAYR